MKKVEFGPMFMKNVLAWRREYIYGLDKKLKWSTKCQLQCSHPELRNGWVREERRTLQRKDARVKGNKDLS